MNILTSNVPNLFHSYLNSRRINKENTKLRKYKLKLWNRGQVSQWSIYTQDILRAKEIAKGISQRRFEGKNVISMISYEKD
jgi:lipopolysaccharide export LptBFGC system permease protein LptF